MERVRIAALFADKEQYGGASVTVCGWAKTIRDMKTFGFIELNDGSCFRNLQVVMDANSLSNYKEIAAQNVGAALIVHGTVVLTPEAKQPLEVKATAIEVEGVSSPDYPLQKKRHSVEYLRTIQHLRPRTNLFSAAFRVRSAAAYAVHEFFQSRGFVYVNTPIITGSDCEGAGEMFQVTTLDLENPPRTPDGKVDYSKDFFGKKTSLTVSGQLNAENFAMAFGDVYTFGPTFRAENSNTARHAAEFWMIEPEMAFCDLNGDMEVAEAMIKHIIRRVMERCPDDLAFFNSFVDKGLLERLQHVAESDFGRVTYTEAVKLLKESGQKFDYPVEWGIDLQTEHERYLTEQIFKRPVFVTDYPQEIKAFYMRLNDDGKTVAAADCLVPGIGEIIGGSQREERIELLEKRIRELGMNPEDYWWYCDLRRYGLDDWMVTADEYKKILQSVYDKGYILVAMEDVWSEVTDETGTHMVRNTLMLPEGKKPLVISFDDVNYYPYMLDEGFTSKLVVGEDGEIWAQCTDPYTNETFLTKELDATPILDQFVYEHPDFSLNGAKAIFSLTGYQGILGYRTQDDRDIAADSPDRPAFDAYRASEIEAVKPVIARLKETGWTFGSHTWGHIRLDTKSLQTVINDTERWADEVGSLVGPTQILFYPHGGRPDGDDWHTTGERFKYLQSQGFRIFASVGTSSFSYVKEDISAVICDRLHPDGTTLRHSRSRYLQFYNAEDIMDTQVRPDLGVDW